MSHRKRLLEVLELALGEHAQVAETAGLEFNRLAFWPAQLMSSCTAELLREASLQ